jgi:hypothetical protein
VLAPQLRDALPAHVVGDVAAADLHLALAHAGVDVDVADLDVERAVLGDSEPGVDLPGEVEEDEEGAREVVLEEGGDDEVGAADGPERDVELGCQAEEVHHGADVGAVDAEGGAEGELVDAVAVVFPVTGLGGEYIVEGGGFYHADRKRMWDTAILPKMKKEERPDKARSQLKMLPPPDWSKLMKAKQPKRS